MNGLFMNRLLIVLSDKKFFPENDFFRKIGLFKNSREKRTVLFGGVKEKPMQKLKWNKQEKVFGIYEQLFTGNLQWQNLGSAN
jgi:hypothetical protein